MNKIVLSILTLALLAVPVAAQNSVYLDPQHSSACCCDTIEVEIRVNATNLGSGQINLTYNPDCANVTKWTRDTTNFPMGGEEPYVGRAWITFMTLDQQLTGDYRVGTLTIHCVREGECNTPLAFIDGSKLFDEEGTETRAIWTDGTFRCFRCISEPGCIEGSVNDEAGNAIGGAAVRAVQDDEVGDGTTDGNGYYKIPDLNPGTYKVTASKEGYASQTKEGVEVITGECAGLNFVLPQARKPDLVIAGVWNEDGKICYTIENTGAATAPDSHRTVLYIDGVNVSSDMVYVELKAGASTDRCFDYRWECTPPQDEVKVCADADNKVDESDETNNCMGAVFRCPLNQMEACRSLAFSTEVDFVTFGPEPADGNPIISDGDLLGGGCVVCARNRELLAVFQCEFDLGLDAADVIDIDFETPLVAFSTELDHPDDWFTAGDLLTTHGAVIPNIALLARFNIYADLGLDAVHFIGERERIIEFLNHAGEFGRDFWLENPGALSEMLEKHEIDIWFSTEGTAPTPENPGFLDGDLLSARTGTIVASNGLLLPTSVPAGIPDRGVDFGLDAVTAGRATDRGTILFSTEILFNGEPPFTDGDIIKLGNGVVRTNEDLINCFEPKVDELGLDALSVCIDHLCVNRITKIGGMQVPVADIGTDGRADLMFPTDHPFGRDVPFWGTICDDIREFRVVYRKADAGIGNGTGIAVQSGEGWMVKDQDIVTGDCIVDVPWFSDANGWYDAARYRELKPCNEPLILTNWNTLGMEDGLYRVWFEFKRNDVVEREPVDHFVQLDNTNPTFEEFDIPNGTCTIYGSADMNYTDSLGRGILVQGQFQDDHFWRYMLRICGDSYPYHGYGLINYYDPGPKAANLDDTGTTPDGTLVDLHRVSVFDLAPSPMECAYSADLLLWDRTIVGTFYKDPYLIGGHFRSHVTKPIYFSYAP